MKILFLGASQNYYKSLYEKCSKGLAKLGHQTYFHNIFYDDIDNLNNCDLYIVFTLEFFTQHKEVITSKPYILFEKGFNRSLLADTDAYLKFSVNYDRLKWKFIDLDNKRNDTIPSIGFNPKLGKDILICTASDIYHQYHHGMTADNYAELIYNQIPNHLKKQTYHRPKPNILSSSNIQKQKASDIRSASSRSLCVIAHGSASLFNAETAGTPTITLDEEYFTFNGNKIEDLITGIKRPSQQRREDLIKFAAYHQYNYQELATETPWLFMRKNYEEIV